MRRELVDHIAGVALLHDPVRRALFTYVGRASAPVGREQAAKATRTTRENAAFHLDRLAEAGLLEVSFRRLNRKSGPGAGRPAKLYQRSARALEVRIPERRYALAATLFADALATSGSDSLRRVATVARRVGVDIGRRARARPPRGSDRVARVRAVMKVLDAVGYEPVDEPTGCLRLRNCPFPELAKEHRTLMCGTNLALIKGIMAGLGGDDLVAQLDPRAGSCCVTIRPP